MQFGGCVAFVNHKSRLVVVGIRTFSKSYAFSSLVSKEEEETIDYKELDVILQRNAAKAFKQELRQLSDRIYISE